MALCGLIDKRVSVCGAIHELFPFCRYYGCSRMFAEPGACGQWSSGADYHARSGALFNSDSGDPSTAVWRMADAGLCSNERGSNGG